MKRFLQIVLLLVASIMWGQSPADYSAVDSKMEAIPKEYTVTTDAIAQYISNSFNSEEDKIRAVFYWCASNISYDVPNMYNQQPNQLKEDRIRNTLSSLKGVCADYVAVFNDIASKLHIQTHEVGGYTKQNQKIVLLSHVWSIALINGKWILIDPTWGAGYVNDSQFTKRLENIYFNSDPLNFIQNHIPFDYIYQLLPHPISNQDFYDNKTQPDDLSFTVDYGAKINALNQLNKVDAMKEAVQRVEQGGLKNNLVIEYVTMLKTNIDANAKNQSAKKLMEISDAFEIATTQYNTFIVFRNHKFEPEVSDSELKSMIETPRATIKRCIAEVSKITNLSRENIQNNKAFIAALYEFEKLTEVQSQFVDEYLKKSTADRKLSFVVRKKR